MLKIHKQLQVNKIILGVSLLLMVSLALPSLSYAQFGTVTNPLPTTSTAPGGGLIALLNNVLRLIFVIAGIYAFIRIVLAGLSFISAGGDPKKMVAAWASIWKSLLGLAIIISSVAIAAIAGQLLFGRYDAILNPQIYGPGP